MSGRHFMPRAQQDFAAWSTVFNSYMAAHGERLGVSPQQVADYDQKHQTMMAADLGIGLGKILSAQRDRVSTRTRRPVRPQPIVFA